MNTKTMRLPPRRVLMPTKRKEREDAPKPASTAKSLKLTAINRSQVGSNKAASVEPESSNQLLAGYLAHEYLTKGTLFGQPFDPAGSEAVFPPMTKGTAMKPGKSEEAEPSKGAGRSNKEEGKYQRYVEVASLLKSDGTHIAGIVNPTQLARFLHM